MSSRSRPTGESKLSTSLSEEDLGKLKTQARLALHSPEIKILYQRNLLPIHKLNRLGKDEIEKINALNLGALLERGELEVSQVKNLLTKLHTLNPLDIKKLENPYLLRMLANNNLSLIELNRFTKGATDALAKVTVQNLLSKELKQEAGVPLRNLSSEKIALLDNEDLRDLIKNKIISRKQFEELDVKALRGLADPAVIAFLKEKVLSPGHILQLNSYGAKAICEPLIRYQLRENVISLAEINNPFFGCAQNLLIPKLVAFAKKRGLSEDFIKRFASSKGFCAGLVARFFSGVLIQFPPDEYKQSSDNTRDDLDLFNADRQNALKWDEEEEKLLLEGDEEEKKSLKEKMTSCFNLLYTMFQFQFPSLSNAGEIENFIFFAGDDNQAFRKERVYVLTGTLKDFEEKLRRIFSSNITEMRGMLAISSFNHATGLFSNLYYDANAVGGEQEYSSYPELVRALFRSFDYDPSKAAIITIEVFAPRNSKKITIPLTNDLLAGCEELVVIEPEFKTSPLHHSTKSNDITSLKFYLATGKYDVNAKTYDVNDRVGTSPFALAAMRGNIEAMRLLVMHGAEIETFDFPKEDAEYKHQIIRGIQLIEELITERRLNLASKSIQRLITHNTLTEGQASALRSDQREALENKIVLSWIETGKIKMTQILEGSPEQINFLKLIADLAQYLNLPIIGASKEAKETPSLDLLIRQFLQELKEKVTLIPAEIRVEDKRIAALFDCLSTVNLNTVDLIVFYNTLSENIGKSTKRFELELLNSFQSLLNKFFDQNLFPNSPTVPLHSHTPFKVYSQLKAVIDTEDISPSEKIERIKHILLPQIEHRINAEELGNVEKKPSPLENAYIELYNEIIKRPHFIHSKSVDSPSISQIPRIR